MMIWWYNKILFDFIWWFDYTIWWFDDIVWWFDEIIWWFNGMIWWFDDIKLWFDDIIWWYEGVGCDLHSDEPLVPRLQYRGHRCQRWMILYAAAAVVSEKRRQSIKIKIEDRL